MRQVPNKLVLFVILSAVFLAASSADVLALAQTYARDILANPLRYQSSVAKIVGEVVKVEPDPVSPGSGMYTVLDGSDTPIRVHTTRQFPDIGEQVYVVGLVYQEDPQAKPYMEELRRGRAAPSLKVLAGAAGILAFIAFILAYLLIWHKPSPHKAEIAPEKSTKKPAVTQVFQDDPVAILSAVQGPHKGQTFNIYRGITTIGREDDQTIRLAEDQTVSRGQARIVAENGCISIVNESATNPTRIGGQPIEKRELADGDLICMGASKLKLTVLEE